MPCYLERGCERGDAGQPDAAEITAPAAGVIALTEPAI
jgi:hypothetical protein